MNKMLIGGLVGGLILFIWQFISWGLVNIHGSSMEYIDNQDEIISAIAKLIPEEGTYFVPRASPTATGEEQEAFAQTMIGKPWARVSFHKSFQNTFGMNLFRGFIIDFLAVLFMCWILLKMRELDFKTVITTCIAVGLIGYLTISYLDSIWFQDDSIPYLIDAIAQWALVGGWLGWWLPRK